jgi:tetratricopeptide (TPR) repeat protein
MKTNILPIVFIVLLQAHFLAGRPINELPMYGGQHDPIVPQNSQFSREASMLGWEYYYEGDFDTAIKRFNQAWMFDRENPEAYWGFGLILSERAEHENPRANLEESVRFLQMAVDRDLQNGKLLGDLAFAYALFGYYLQHIGEKNAGHFERAKELFDIAHEMEPSHPPIIANLSLFYYYTRDYETAKEKMKQAQSLGFQFDPDYPTELEKKLRQNKPRTRRQR